MGDKDAIAMFLALAGKRVASYAIADLSERSHLLFVPFDIDGFTLRASFYSAPILAELPQQPRYQLGEAAVNLLGKRVEDEMNRQTDAAIAIAELPAGERTHWTYSSEIGGIERL